MRNKRKRPSLLLVGLVIVLATSVMACGQPASAPKAMPTVTVTTAVTTTVTVTTAPPSTSPKAPSAISWDKAKDHIGERTTVYGPVIGATYASGSKGKPTFLNVGKNHPDPARFTVLIWGSDRSKFSPAPEIQYKGKTIYVYGLIDEYPKGSGSAQIVVTSPDQIQAQ